MSQIGGSPPIRSSSSKPSDPRRDDSRNNTSSDIATALLPMSKRHRLKTFHLVLPHYPFPEATAESSTAPIGV